MKPVEHDERFWISDTPAVAALVVDAREPATLAGSRRWIGRRKGGA
ncbi:hypothetical protein [Sorangium sp. So ce233]